ncbi:MAG: cyclic pyranopterin monophosphate synthase MoaC [Chlorobi bacterium]|nr:cyclic pyranopterin monophosphate synthase MoaC [Chlorobiota bacterium]
MGKLSHINEKGKAEMVDVGGKPDQLRQAIARGFIKLQPQTLKLIEENKIKKGDVLTVAEIAGIQAAKQCPALIPLCHTLMLNKVKVECKLVGNGVVANSLVRCTGKTGVEMEALTAVSVALLTVYDMCKAVDKNMELGEIKLLEKTKTDI